MVSLEEFKAQYTAYKDVPDQELADALHAKYYSNIPKAQYYAQIGLVGKNAPASTQSISKDSKPWEDYAPAQTNSGATEKTLTKQREIILENGTILKFDDKYTNKQIQEAVEEYMNYYNIQPIAGKKLWEDYAPSQTSGQDLSGLSNEELMRIAGISPDQKGATEKTFTNKVLDLAPGVFIGVIISLFIMIAVRYLSKQSTHSAQSKLKFIGRRLGKFLLIAALASLSAIAIFIAAFFIIQQGGWIGIISICVLAILSLICWRIIVLMKELQVKINLENELARKQLESQ